MLEPSGQRYPPFLACFSLPNNTACWSVLTSTKQPFFKCFLVASALRLWLQSISKRSRLVVIIIIFIHDFIMIIDCHQHHKFIRFKCQAKKIFSSTFRCPETRPIHSTCLRTMFRWKLCHQVVSVGIRSQTRLDLLRSGETIRVLKTHSRKTLESCWICWRIRISRIAPAHELLVDLCLSGVALSTGVQLNATGAYHMQYLQMRHRRWRLSK